MFDAIDIHTGERFRFKSLDSLVRRYRGNDYQLEHDGAFDPPMRTVQILRRKNTKAGRWADVLASVRVPTEATRD